MGLIESEMSRLGIWPQPDGRFAVSEAEVPVLTPADVAVCHVKHDLAHYAKLFRGADGIDRADALLYARLVKIALRKLNLMCEWLRLSKRSNMIRTAAYPDDTRRYEYDRGTVPGPWSNVLEPEHTTRWEETDLKDINDAIKQLPRYHPDDDMDEFDLWHKEDPVLFDDVMKGEGNLPMMMQGVN
jgi:hypothetical protein